MCVPMYRYSRDKGESYSWNLWGCESDSCLWHILLRGSSIIWFLFPHASVSPHCTVHNYKCSFDHDALVVPEIFAVRRTSLLAPAVAE